MINRNVIDEQNESSSHLEMWQLAIIDVFKERFQLRWILGFGCLQRLQDIQASIVVQHLVLLFIDPSPLLQILLGSIDWITGLLPVLDLCDRAISSRIVRGRVMPLTIRHGLDQNWSAMLQNVLSSRPSRDVDSKEVVAIHTHRWDAVASATGCNAVAIVLIFDGSTDGKAIIATEEEHWALSGRSEIQGSVKVAFTGSAFPKEADRDAIFFGQFERVRSAYSLQKRTGMRTT